MMKPELGEILNMLSVAYPRFKVPEDTARVYYMLLKDLPVGLLKAAALQCATNGDFFPSVHELRSTANEIQRKAANIPTAYEAWQDLKKAGSGGYSDVKEIDGKFYVERYEHQFIHPVVKEVGEMLGWPREFPGDNPVADRAHFFKAYDQTVAERMADEIRLPEVKNYIEQARHNLLEAGNGDQQETSRTERSLLEGD